MTETVDTIIIGAGVIGCAVAQRLGQYAGSVVVLERAGDVSEGASKANSGIIHAGHDAIPGTDKARLNVKGARMFESMCRQMGVPYGKAGALVLAFAQEERPHLQLLLDQARANQVPDCRIIEREEILRLEPNINPQVVCALDVPQSALASPYEFTCALADSAAENGVRFVFDTAVAGLSYQDGLWRCATASGAWQARAVINCAGTGAGVLHNQISTRPVRIIPRRGQYYLIDHEDHLAFSRTLFQVPTKMGKGVLVSPTTHGNLLIGPTAEDIDDGLDTVTTRAGLDQALEKARLTWPGLSLRNVITTFSGIRAHEEKGDFIIGAVEGAPAGAFEAIGIESPGLSAAPAIGEELGDWVAYWLKLGKNTAWRAPTPPPKAFAQMSDQERRQAYENNPLYGRIVCRCEQVTEAEVRYAMRRPLPARSLDGVKRRTRAGMGRCQGGFCSPRVMQLLAEEMGVDPLAVTKFGAGSYVLSGAIGAQPQEARHE